MHRPVPAEAQALVYRDRAAVVFTHMQERDLSCFADDTKLVFQEFCGVAFTQEIRVRTNGAHFRVIEDMQPLPGHRRKPAIFEKPVIASEIDGAVVEGTRFCQRSQRHHFFNMGIVQR
ncbi:MAG: hypothetical protein K0Q66_1741 [Chitinophagaceae bacterium]|nr:hypothetical protein [Chitinophagaceae bacterium]